MMDNKDSTDAQAKVDVPRGAARISTGAAWHILQYSDALDLELATTLARNAPTILWKPDRSRVPLRPNFLETEESVPASTLKIRSFPLVRGYSRAPISMLARVGPELVRRLSRQSPNPRESVLVCTIPYFAPVAELWPGPVVYWLTDLMIRYAGVEPGPLLEMDRALCARADLVCPASYRLAEYLHKDARCERRKIQVLPNAVRESSLLDAPLTAPDRSALPEIPDDVPVAGVIGHLSDNMDWVLLEALLEGAPWLHWAFVGPSQRPGEDEAQGVAFDRVRANPRSYFVGHKPYGELWRYARAFSVAVLPYKRREPTFSGSSTRFYEHLAAGHPILATPCVEELTRREPLLTLVDTAADALAALETLRAVNFEDGLRHLRWQVSKEHTWQTRATVMQDALEERMPARMAEPATALRGGMLDVASLLQGEGSLQTVLRG